MKKLLCVLLVFVTTPVLPKERCLSEMKKELRVAEVELETLLSTMMCLREAIAAKEIKQIEKDLEQSSTCQEHRLDFLDLQRKNISSIMQEVPSVVLQAQHILDKILMEITSIKESSSENA